MGTGDWNDGMNHVGSGGHGESVWLGWFYCTTATLFAQVIESRDAKTAEALRNRAKEAAATIERTCWDGEWYLRAFFDDGTPLGSHIDVEAKIDSIAQSWAVLSGMADRAHALQAMESCERLLVKETDRAVLLFTPAFDHSTPHPGYIMGYPPGVRENGGQYTHGSLWLAAAFARLGNGAAAVKLLKLMNPVESSRTPEATDHFKGRAFLVSPADVSFSPGKEKAAPDGLGIQAPPAGCIGSGLKKCSASTCAAIRLLSRRSFRMIGMASKSTIAIDLRCTNSRFAGRRGKMRPKPIRLFI